MGLYQNDSGVLTPIAGRGKLGFGISDYKYGTIIIPSIPAKTSTGTPGFAFSQITFDKPFADNNYIISIQNMGNAYCSTDSWTVENTGFNLYLTNHSLSTLSNVPVDWYAFKPYTDVEYNNLTALTHYSTTEQLVGTWIDGKPLYQLTFTMKTPSATGTTSYNLSAYNIDKIISEDAMLQRTTNDMDHVINWHYNNNNHDMCTYYDFSKGLYYINKRSGTSDMNADAFITLKYTKK